MVNCLQRRWSAWWLVVLWGFFAQAHAGELFSARDDQGHLINLQAAPGRIVSLLPSLTETVCVLGACERLVGVDRWSNWPASVRGLARVGGLDDANVEAIVALRPDLVLASPSSRLADRLRALHLQVAEFEAQSLDDVPRILKGVGQLLGKSAQAEQAWSEIQRRLQTAAGQVPPRAKGTRLYFEVATTPYAAGESSFIGQLWTRLAGRNIIPASMGPFPKINPEFVVRADPDLIILSKADAPGLMRRPGWDRLRAVRQGDVCALSPADYDLMARPGPRLGQAAGVLLRCLQAHAQRLDGGR